MPLRRLGVPTIANMLHADRGAAGSSRAHPAAVNAEIVAGPWKMTLLQVQTGAGATAAVTGASTFNAAPGEGSTYVVAKVRAQNTLAREFDIEPDDFGVTGSAGFLYRFSQQMPPDPPLHGTVAAGKTIEGWVVAEVPSSETNLLLVYDSLSITGTWSDGVFALSDGAIQNDVAKPAQAKNETGSKANAPAGAGDQIATAEWAVKLIEVVTGQDAIKLFPTADYRTTALLGPGPQVADNWLALHFQVTNTRTGGARSFLPATAFLLATNDGKPVNDVSLLTPPEPAISGDYYPGASRDGWVMFEQPSTYPDSLVRFLPFVTDSDQRYLKFGGGASSQTPATVVTVAPGAKVTVTEQTVNLRATASVDGKILAELKQGDTLTVTGAPVSGGAYDWYPVTVDATGTSGFVAVNFVKAAG